MSNTIDCSIMSHIACEEPMDLPAPNQSAPPAPAATKGEPLVASYDCVNNCASSLGVTSLVESAVAGLGCLALPPACPAFVVAVPATIIEACDQACRDLEKP
jgi:hypothetical protein